MRQNYPTNSANSAQRNNPSNQENAQTSPPPTAGPPTIRHQPRGQNRRWNQRVYREFDGGWMQLPKGIPNCPAGLEYLATIDQLLVCQQLEVLEIISGFETENRYMVKSVTGQKIYYARERSGCCCRNCCGRFRQFDMQILDQFGNEVIRLYRPLACDSCCCPCCLQVLEVFAPPNNFIGVIEQKWSLCIPTFSVKNSAGNTVLRIEGPCCITSCFNDIDFKILSADGRQQIGVITKQWSGFARELFTDADYFGITFPMNLDVKMKAVMLGACFLIDFMFFENNND